MFLYVIGSVAVGSRFAISTKFLTVIGAAVPNRPSLIFPNVLFFYETINITCAVILGDGFCNSNLNKINDIWSGILTILTKH